MILDWLAQTPALLIALVVVLFPGALSLWGVGLRGLALLALAPLMTVAILGVTAIIFGFLGIGWSVVTVLLAVLVFAAATWGAGVWLGRVPRRPAGSTVSWLLVVALALGAVLTVSRLMAYIGDPAAISQTNDAVFHLNALQFILDTANASSLHVSGVVGAQSFYPAAWHAVAAVIAHLSGVSLPIAANMLTLVIAAVVWPLGLSWLTRLIAGPVAAAFAAVMVGVLQQFPLLLFQWGVLYPNALSTAMLPAALALVIAMPGWIAERWHWRSVTRAGLLLSVATAAISLAHPSGLLFWGACSLVWLSFALLQSPESRAKVSRWVIVVALWVAFVPFWLALSSGSGGSHWDPFRGRSEAIVDVVLNGQLRLPHAWEVSVFMLIGLVVAVRVRQQRWLVVAWLGASALYLLVATVGRHDVRGLLLGAWYADPYRITALAPTLVIPLAALGLYSLVKFAHARIGGKQGLTLWAGVTVAALAVGVGAVASFRPAAMPEFLENRFESQSRYAHNEDSFLSVDERTLLEALPDYVEPGSLVIGNPSTGSGFGYMLSGTDVYPRNWSHPRSQAWRTLMDDLRRLDDVPEVCPALDATGSPRYVLDFGPGDRSPGRQMAWGMTNFANRDGFELVVTEGDASLWRITGCAP